MRKKHAVLVLIDIFTKASTVFTNCVWMQCFVAMPVLVTVKWTLMMPPLFVVSFLPPALMMLVGRFTLGISRANNKLFTISYLASSYDQQRVLQNNVFLPHHELSLSCIRNLTKYIAMQLGLMLLQKRRPNHGHFHLPTNWSTVTATLHLTS